MNIQKQVRRRLGIGLIVIIASVGNWFRLTGTENIRAIHIVTLLACGMGIGIFLIGLISLFRKTE